MFQRTGKIEYAMAPNPLQQGTYSAIVQHDRKIDMPYLVQNIAERTSLNNSTVQAVILALVDEIGKEVANGNIVIVNGLASFRAALHVPAHTTDAEYEITPDNAKLSIDTRSLSEIKHEVEARATYKRVAHAEKAPIIHSFQNLVTKAADTFRVGDVIALKGEHLKGEAVTEGSSTPAQGIFLLDTTDGVETQVSAYLKNTEKNYEFMVPPKASGSYSNAIKVEVRLIYTPSGTLRTGTYPRTVDGLEQVGTT